MPPKHKAPPRPKFDKNHKPVEPTWSPAPISSNCPAQWNEYYHQYGVLHNQWKEDLEEWKALYGGDTDSGDEGEGDDGDSDSPQCRSGIQSCHGHYLQDILEDALADAINTPLPLPPMTQEEFMQTLPSLIALFTAYTKANESVADEAEETGIFGMLVPQLAEIPADAPEIAPCTGIILNAETSRRGSGSLEDGYWLRCRSSLKATAKAQKIYRS
ncbi:hypothetical protein FA13DRAFT_1799608 [Coprinellus micaceus]|uniref:Uncharacterized protein n=1 Tax=Coprinellus micaceus TaxID=71717 RepID=A0A4Y7SK79_COPMI|nr:hypothetical protein FA13DRAFT_1799608 [Coprinellus micaceus]